ncbi:S41 family peptidase [Candidatus Roseilinea sp. NK_OTU-006]|jgi:C-terminal peptidase prc|uniref:S41 family peptidase n=1 Tax=Candidatus Roseilinea sp. NK_OTU-006 TaxID=2704250 RepID=UPI00145F2CB4|nr:S41 family peptidase [Candidatus Roseilinea sp. NK_OTU-006]
MTYACIRVFLSLILVLTGWITSTDVALAQSSSPFAAPLQPFKLDRARQVFMRTWQFIHDHYVYPDFNGLDWQSIRAEYEPKVRAAQTLPEFYRLMAEMVSRLNDGHSTFLPPQQAGALQSYRLGSGTASVTGLAASLRRMPDHSLLVLQVIPNSKAEAALKPGDRIVAIEGARLDREDRAHLLYGRAGLVRVTVQPPNGAPHEASIERETYSTALIPPPVVAHRLPDDIGYLAIYDFLSFTTGMRAREALLRLLRDGRLNGLIVDMRANDGGMIGQMVDVLALLIDGGSAGSYVSRSGEVDAYTIPRGRTIRALDDVPVVVLAGPGTNSSGDIFVAVMQASGRARVVGMPTPGNVEMLQALRLPDGSVLWAAVKHYRDPKGRFLEGRGVQPDRLVDVEWWRYALQDDPQVKAAIGLIALGR